MGTDRNHAWTPGPESSRCMFVKVNTQNCRCVIGSRCGRLTGVDGRWLRSTCQGIEVLIFSDQGLTESLENYDEVGEVFVCV